MEKITLMLIALMIIITGLLSGCSQTPVERNNPPTASLSANPVQGIVSFPVRFTGNGSDIDGYIISYYWNFGDGSNSSQQNSSHTYIRTGTYTVTLTVTDNSGANDTQSIIVTQSHKPTDIHLTQNGINYICQNFGNDINCCVETGLQWQWTDIDNITGIASGGTAEIIGHIIFPQLIRKITMIYPARGNFTYTQLRAANNGQNLTLNDCDEIKLHDGGIGEDQWCYQ